MKKILVLALLSWGAALQAVAHAWHAGGHMLLTQAAMMALPEELPPFFREAGPILAHLSVDPDVFKHRQTLQLTDRQAPDHYLDLELLQGRALPDQRHAYIELCQELNLKPAKVGYLPYAIAEHAQQLTLAFAEYRRFPDNPAVRMKVQVYAGLLAHYAADLVMPLHTTIHFNGRVDSATGRSPPTGIHARVDALIEQMQPALDPLTRGIRPAPMDSLWEGIQRELRRSHALVDATYELEPLLPAKDAAPADFHPQVRAFTLERARHGVQFLADLYLTAWRDSAKLELPDWLIQARERD